MKLYTIKNKTEEKLLRTKLRPFDFEKYSPAQIKKLVKEMDEKMQKWEGIGLAANQAGLNSQFFVARYDGKFYSLFNPRITKFYGELEEKEEGCLSIPNKYGITKRYEKITITGQDKKGKTIKIKAKGLLAHIFQHEIDHLHGILYTDHAISTYKLPKDEK